jgi:hypothetical protein
MRIFPKDFHMVNMPVKMMWNLWFFGDGKVKIHSYKLVKDRKQYFDLTTKRDKALYSKASKVVCYIEEMARILSVLSPDRNVSTLLLVQSEEIFDSVFIDVVQVLYPERDYCDRIFDLTYTAIYNKNDITKAIIFVITYIRNLRIINTIE